MFVMVFGPLLSLAINAQVCAVNPADTQSVIDAMRPGACAKREEVYIVNP